MGFKAIGEKAVLLDLLGVGPRFEQGLKEAGMEAGDILVRTAQQGMDGASSPAGPGGYPGNLSGTLRAGLKYAATPNALYFKSTGVSIRGKGGKSGAPLFLFMEDGTKKMEARPVISSAVRDAKSEVDKTLRHKPFKRLG